MMDCSDIIKWHIVALEPFWLLLHALPIKKNINTINLSKWARHVFAISLNGEKLWWFRSRRWGEPRSELKLQMTAGMHPLRRLRKNRGPSVCNHTGPRECRFALEMWEINRFPSRYMTGCTLQRLMSQSGSKWCTEVTENVVSQTINRCQILHCVLRLTAIQSSWFILEWNVHGEIKALKAVEEMSYFRPQRLKKKANILQHLKSEFEVWLEEFKQRFTHFSLITCVVCVVNVLRYWIIRFIVIRSCRSVHFSGCKGFLFNYMFIFEVVASFGAELLYSVFRGF